MATIPANPINDQAPEPITMAALLASLRDQLSDSSALAAWGVAHYDRPVTVFLGYDHRNPPADDQYPLVNLSPGSVARGLLAAEDEYLVGISCGVHDATGTADVRDNVSELAARRRLEELLEMVIAEVEGAELYGGMVAGLQVDYRDAEYYPYLLADLYVQLLLPKVFDGANARQP